MALYRQLLLSSGGGVVSGTQQDEQNTCATLAIGLGGTGVTCLRNLKKQVYSRLQPDDPNSPIPEYSHIRFLAVDSDKSSLGADGAFNSLDETTEYFPISTDDINGLLRSTNKLAGTPEYNWLITEKDGRGLTVLSAVAGAGGVRQIGRLLMMQKSSEFCSRVEQAVSDATRGLPGNSELVVHIFAGIGGGTGSGTFLDACYLVQRALSRAGNIGKAKVCGYIFLPDVTLSTLDPSSATAKYVKANGFAAMKELDYCMNFQNNRGCWDQQYKGFHIGPTQDPPVQICHLVSAHDVAGQNLEDGFSYAMNVVSDFVMQFLVKPQPSDNATNTLTMQSHIDNYYKNMDVVSKTTGASYKYCLLGASNAIVPMKEITTYLSSALFENMSQGTSRRPTDEEVKRFAEDIGLTYDKLEQAIINGTNYRMPPINMDHKQCQGLSEEDINLTGEIILPEVIMKPYRDRLLSSMKNQVSTNVSALTNPWSKDDIEKDQQSVSKVCAAYFGLRNLVIDPELGPFYASELLNGSQTTNLINHLNGIQKQVSANLQSERDDLDLRINQVKRLRHEYLSGGLLTNKKKKFEEFIAAVAGYFSQEGKIYMLEQMELMLPKMIKQFTQLYTEHFMVYQTVSRNLFDTFHNNYQTLTTASLNEAISDPFILPLMEISDMKPSLDKMVKNMKMDMQTKNFHAFLFDRPDVWIDGDEHKICKEVSRYLVDIFHDYTNKSLIDYLEIRFNTSNPAQLQDSVYQQIMLKLEEKAEALFWAENRGDIANANPLGYISVPDSAAALIAAADKLHQKSPYLNKCPSKLKDRIFILKCLCGIPMYQYNGIHDYGSEYNGDTTVGKHLYEKTERDPRDWRGLPNLQPYSINENRTEAMEKAAKEYDRAVELGIIRAKPDSPVNLETGKPLDYELLVWPEIDTLVTNAKEAAANGDTHRINQAIEAIRNYNSEKMPVRSITVTNDGAVGHEQKVRKDHILASHEMMNVLQNELNKVEQIEECIKLLETGKSEVSRTTELKENFFNAICSGVIDITPPNVTYIEEIFGITKEIPLSEPKMEPFGKYVPLYQAYKTYLQMEETKRSQLDERTADRLNDTKTWRDKMQESCASLLNVFKNEYMGMMQRNAQKCPDDMDAMIDLLIEFRQKIGDFKSYYGLE